METFRLPYAGAPPHAPNQRSCIEVHFWKATSEYEAHVCGPAHARVQIGFGRRLYMRHIEAYDPCDMHSIVRSLQRNDARGCFDSIKNGVLGGVFALEPDAAAQAILQIH